MFRKKPTKSELQDQLDVQIEEHSRISNRLDKDYEVSKADAERNAKRGLMKAAKMAFQSMQFVKNKLESTEITKIRLRQIKTSLVALPDRVPDKTVQGVDRILRESRSILHKTEVMMGTVMEGESLSMEMSLDDVDAITEGSNNEFDSFLKEIGLGEPVASEQPASQPVVSSPVTSGPQFTDLPEVPSSTPVEDPEEEEDLAEDQEISEEKQ